MQPESLLYQHLYYYHATFHQRWKCGRKPQIWRFWSRRWTVGFLQQYLTSTSACWLVGLLACPSCWRAGLSVMLARAIFDQHLAVDAAVTRRTRDASNTCENRAILGYNVGLDFYCSQLLQLLYHIRQLNKHFISLHFLQQSSSSSLLKLHQTSPTKEVYVVVPLHRFLRTSKRRCYCAR